jgi:50S ribosomal protein uL30
MICAIRIIGEVKVEKTVAETLKRMRLKKKYSCIVLANPKKEDWGMITKAKDSIAFGEIDKKTFQELLEKRGHLLKKSAKEKIDAKKVIEGLEKGKKYEEMNVKPFFNLHPPRKGINTKEQFPKGSLGNHREKINELVMRML